MREEKTPILRVVLTIEVKPLGLRRWSSPLPGRQRAQTRAERGKALYGPTHGDLDDNTGRDTTFRRLEKILPARESP